MAKKKKQTIGYKYFASGHFVLCHGPIDSITKISFQDKEAYQVEQSTNKTIYISKPSLFGGDEQQGGIEGNVEILFGHANQQKSSNLQRICANISNAFNGLISAYRGVCSVVLNNVYIGTSPSLPDSKWRVKRIHTRHDGEKQWYDSKAEIGTISVSDLTKIAFILDDSGSMSAANMSNMKTGVNNILSKLADQKIDVMVQAINSGVRIYRQATSANIIAAQSFVNSLVASGGTSATSAYGNINTFFNGDYKNGQVITLSDGEMSSVPEAKSMIATAFSKVKFVGLGMGTVGSLNEFDNTGNAVQVVDADGIAAALNSIFYSEADLNPAHIIRECLTNKIWGIGVSESSIDDVSFKNAADTLFREGMGISIKWTDSTSINEFIDNIKEHINAQLYLDRTTNKWKLYLIRDDYDFNALISLDESNIRNLDFERRTLAECVNAVTVTYYDRERAKDSTVTVQDIARIAQQGGVISQSIDYKGFTNSNIAGRIALRDLKTLSSTLASVSFDVDERFSESWHEGMPFKLSDSSYGLSEAVMRIRTIKRGDGINNTVYVEAIEDSFSSPMQSVIEYVPPVTGADSAAQDADAIAFEVPYIELVEQYGQDEVDSKLANYPDLGYVGMAAIRPNNQHVNASLYVDAGAGYDERTTLDFCPSASLKNDIGYMDSSFEIQSVAEFELLEVNHRIQVNDEIMGFVNFDTVTNMLTVKRGCFDTVPQKHNAGSKIFGWDNYSGIDSIEYLSGEILSLKALTLTGSDVLELNDATAHSLTLSSRAIRPYPPANVRVNDEYWPNSIEGDAELTWVDRNRLQQTGGSNLGWFDSGVSIEPEVEYVCEVWENDHLVDTLLNVQSGLTFTQQEYYPEKLIRLFSQSNGVQSLQKVEIRLQSGIGRLKNTFRSIYSINEAVDFTLLLSVGNILNASVVNGELPLGWELSGSKITGAATTQGIYDFTIQVEDNQGNLIGKSFSVMISGVMWLNTQFDTLNDKIGGTWTLNSGNSLVNDVTRKNGLKTLRLGNGESVATSVAKFSNQVPASLMNADFTISAWIKRHPLKTGSRVFKIGSTGSNVDRNSFQFTGAKSAQWYRNSNGSIMNLSGTYVGEMDLLNEWIHVAEVRKGNMAYLFLAGQLVATASLSSSMSSNRDLLLGGLLVSGSMIYTDPLWIDEIKIYQGVGLWTESYDQTIEW